MLDVMRRHASSWLIKVILGAIIITFIFFFGYSSFRKGARAGRLGSDTGTALTVNGMSVSRAEFEINLNNNYEQLKQSFKDKDIPEFARKLAQQKTISMLVARELALQDADLIGINVSDKELADAIIGSYKAQGRDFDAVAYKHEFLPYFKNKNGLDYEQLVRQDMRIGKLDVLFSGVDREMEASGKTDKEDVWTFETVVFDPKAMIEAKVVEKEEDAKLQAEKISALSPKEWPKNLKKLKLETKKIGPIKIGERNKLLDGSATYEEYKNIFALSKEKPVLEKPLEKSGKFYLLRFVEKTQIPVNGPTKSGFPQDDFLGNWMTKDSDLAKIEKFTDEQN